MLKQVTKTLKSGEVLTFKEIPYNTAKRMMIENHYSKKWNTSFGKINIGVFKNDTLLGAAVFGNLMNPKSFRSVSKNFTKDCLIELNRLWIDDCLGFNTETMLLSASFKIIRNNYPHIKAVQSFADGRLGCGTIYKAANFKYFGYSESTFFRDIDTGEVFHKVPLENTKRPLGFISKNLRYLEGKLESFKVKTYRYIFPIYKNVKFDLKECDYPEYDKGETLVDFQHSKSLLTRLKIMIEYVKADSEFLPMIYEALKNVSVKEMYELGDKQRNNSSVIWFKKEYCSNPNNLQKIKEILKGDPL